MDNFKIIYQILKYLEAALDAECLDPAAFGPEKFRITRERWEQLLIMLQDAGYIKGLVCTQSTSDDRPRLVDPIRPMLTLKGLEYLSENSTMKKAAALLKGIKEVVPGI